MNNDLETILDACLNQIVDDKSSIAECLRRYPEHSAQLQPLLEAATHLKRGRDVVPNPTYKARARSQLNTYMQQNPQRKRLSPVFWRFAISLVTVLLLFLASGTAFAQSALPGDTFYNWKLTSETVWRLTSTDGLGADLALSDRRVHELIEVSGDRVRRARAVEKYELLLIKFNAEQNAEKQVRIVPILRSQHQMLIEAGISVPELEIYFPR